MMRLIRKLTGHGRRQEEAEEVVRNHKQTTSAPRREVKARVAAIERLVQHLKEDTTWL